MISLLHTMQKFIQFRAGQISQSEQWGWDSTGLPAGQCNWLADCMDYCMCLPPVLVMHIPRMYACLSVSLIAFVRARVCVCVRVCKVGLYHVTCPLSMPCSTISLITIYKKWGRWGHKVLSGHSKNALECSRPAERWPQKGGTQHDVSPSSCDDLFCTRPEEGKIIHLRLHRHWTQPPPSSAYSSY